MSDAVVLGRETLGYGATVVLRDVTVALARGERVALLGRSGAGKSTLLAALYRRLTERGRRLALVPQELALVPQLSVFHNVYIGRLEERSAAYNLANLLAPWPAERRRVRPVLAAVGLEAEERRTVESLSGGQKQRVALARSFFRGGDVLLGDEPLSAVDPKQAAGLLAGIDACFPTTVLAMHDVALALDYASRIIGIRDGHIVIDRPAVDLSRADVDALYTR